MNLTCCRVIGFFSIPSPSLAEHNPAAYAAAMTDLPPNAGTCCHCGTGIRHHVVCEAADGTRFHVGTECALKVGAAPEAVHLRMTSDQVAERNAERTARQDEAAREASRRADNRRVYLQHRRDEVGDIVQILLSTRSEFHMSLARQLADGPLSARQAFFVAKLTSSTGRRNRTNAAAWDEIVERCTAEPAMPYNND